MQNRETRFEKDPQLGRNDSLAHKSARSSSNKWTEAMKTVPSYTEHMKQVKSKTVPCHDAFEQATGKSVSRQSPSNAFSRYASPGQNSSRAVSNNAFKSATNFQSRSTEGTEQMITAGHEHSAGKSR